MYLLQCGRMALLSTSLRAETIIRSTTLPLYMHALEGPYIPGPNGITEF